MDGEFGFDFGALGRRGDDEEIAAAETQAFAHADEADARGLRGGVEADAEILDGKAELAVVFGEQDQDFLGVTVLYGIRKSFLGDAEEAKGDVRRKRGDGFLGVKIDLQTVVVRILPTQIL